MAYVAYFHDNYAELISRPSTSRPSPHKRKRARVILPTVSTPVNVSASDEVGMPTSIDIISDYHCDCISVDICRTWFPQLCQLSQYLTICGITPLNLFQGYDTTPSAKEAVVKKEEQQKQEEPDKPLSEPLFA